MPAGVFSKLLGTLSSFFQIGGTAGPGINANGAVLETKNAANNAFAVHRGATPVGDNDLTTKAYVDKMASKPLPASIQFNGNNVLPNNSGTEQWYVVTTSGANATIGQLLWDDGSGAGVVAVIPAVTGNTIVTTVAFSGWNDLARRQSDVRMDGRSVAGYRTQCRGRHVHDSYDARYRDRELGNADSGQCDHL